MYFVNRLLALTVWMTRVKLRPICLQKGVLCRKTGTTMRIRHTLIISITCTPTWSSLTIWESMSSCFVIHKLVFFFYLVRLYSKETRSGSSCSKDRSIGIQAPSDLWGWLPSCPKKWLNLHLLKLGYKRIRIAVKENLKYSQFSYLETPCPF